MENPNTDQRLTDLEIKASFTEDLVDQLNEIIVRQQQQIDLLVREVGALRQQQPEGGARALSQPGDDLPPHY
ncbi:SlyX family protein [Polaromonas sp.]|jgi:SlyX protein|uniref:SlyX family protein n=1 Tax=Polaromonas sp. TaxID=1869339 RepID=UPI001D1DC2AD|nr:SlyX family protein [Polaromonas sp.]MBT9475079.1 SlyX family protein [Polaromonas sp.]